MNTNIQKKHLLKVLLNRIKELKQHKQKQIFETINTCQWHLKLKKDTQNWVVVGVFKKDLLEADINIKWHNTWVRIPKEYALKAIALGWMP